MTSPVDKKVTLTKEFRWAPGMPYTIDNEGTYYLDEDPSGYEMWNEIGTPKNVAIALNDPASTGHLIRILQRMSARMNVCLYLYEIKLTVYTVDVWDDEYVPHHFMLPIADPHHFMLPITEPLNKLLCQAIIFLDGRHERELEPARNR